MPVKAAVQQRTKPVTEHEVEQLRAVCLDVIARLPLHKNTAYRTCGAFIDALLKGLE